MGGVEELDKVEVAVDTVADRVEEMAEKVEHFVDDIADDLPEGSALRDTLEKVESVADRIGKDAHMVSDLVDKVLFHGFQLNLFVKVFYGSFYTRIYRKFQI